MKNSKDLKRCLGVLQPMLRRDNLKPEQKKNIGEAVEEIRRLSRKSHPTRAEVNHGVSRIAEALIRAFFE